MSKNSEPRKWPKVFLFTGAIALFLSTTVTASPKDDIDALDIVETSLTRCDDAINELMVLLMSCTPTTSSTESSSTTSTPTQPSSTTSSSTVKSTTTLTSITPSTSPTTPNPSSSATGLSSSSSTATQPSLTSITPSTSPTTPNPSPSATGLSSSFSTPIQLSSSTSSTTVKSTTTSTSSITPSTFSITSTLSSSTIGLSTDNVVPPEDYDIYLFNSKSVNPDLLLNHFENWDQNVDIVLENMTPYLQNISNNPLSTDDARSLDTETEQLNILINRGQKIDKLVLNSNISYLLTKSQRTLNLTIQDEELVSEKLDEAEKSRRVNISLITIAVIICIALIAAGIAIGVKQGNKQSKRSDSELNIISSTSNSKEDLPPSSYMNFSQRFGIPRVRKDPMTYRPPTSPAPPNLFEAGLPRDTGSPGQNPISRSTSAKY